jgi:saccharopine dehydrogenase-like NADP-dependent oxidoreductase
MSETRKAVLILGCGFTGSVLAQRLTFKGTPVIGTTRSMEQASVIRTRGAEPMGRWGEYLRAMV